MPSRINLSAAWELFRAKKPTGTEREFRDLFYLHSLPVWCNGHLIENVHAVSVGVGVISVFEAWRRFPDWGWETDREELERLLKVKARPGAKTKYDWPRVDAIIIDLCAHGAPRNLASQVNNRIRDLKPPLDPVPPKEQVQAYVRKNRKRLVGV